MKKKIEHLLHEGRLAENAEFKKLHKAYKSAKAVAGQAKTTKATAQSAYRAGLEGQSKGQSDQLFEAMAEFRKSKYMLQYHRIEVKLAKHHLHNWVERWLQKSEVPHEPTTKASKNKAATPKTKKRQSASAITQAPVPTRAVGEAKAVASKRKKSANDQN